MLTLIFFLLKTSLKDHESEKKYVFDFKLGYIQGSRHSLVQGSKYENGGLLAVLFGFPIKCIRDPLVKHTGWLATSLLLFPLHHDSSYVLLVFVVSYYTKS